MTAESIPAGSRRSTLFFFLCSVFFFFIVVCELSTRTCFLMDRVIDYAQDAANDCIPYGRLAGRDPLPLVHAFAFFNPFFSSSFASNYQLPLYLYLPSPRRGVEGKKIRVQYLSLLEPFFCIYTYNSWSNIAPLLRVIGKRWSLPLDVTRDAPSTVVFALAGCAKGCDEDFSFYLFIFQPR